VEIYADIATTLSNLVALLVSMISLLGFLKNLSSHEWHLIPSGVQTDFLIIWLNLAKMGTNPIRKLFSLK
jgi:hypothetical protein